MATKIASNKAEIETKDKQIASLKSDPECSMNLLDNIKKITASKDKKTASLESKVKISETIDIVDLASEGIECANKQPRTHQEYFQEQSSHSSQAKQ